MIIPVETRRDMLSFIRQRIEEKFTGKSSSLYQKLKADPLLQKNSGAFVTLKKDGELRGCIGMIVSDIPLIETLKSMAHQSAFHDPRFYPVEKHEIAELEIEISVLTEPSDIPSWKDVRIGVDGIILECKRRSAVFLPQVATDQNWNIETTLRHLSIKAGLPAEAWKGVDCRFSVFQAEHFNEKDYK